MLYNRKKLLEYIKSQRYNVLTESYQLFNKYVDGLYNRNYSFKHDAKDMETKKNIIKNFLETNPNPSYDDIVSLMKTMPDYEKYENYIIKIYGQKDNVKDNVKGLKGVQDIIQNIQGKQDIIQNLLSKYEEEFVRLFMYVKNSMFKDKDSERSLADIKRIANNISYLYLDEIVDELYAGKKIKSKDGDNTEITIFLTYQNFIDLLYTVNDDGELIGTGIKGLVNIDDVSNLLNNEQNLKYIYRLLYYRGDIANSIKKRNSENRKFKFLLTRYKNEWQKKYENGELKSPPNFSTISFKGVLKGFESKYNFTSSFPKTLEKTFTKFQEKN